MKTILQGRIRKEKVDSLKGKSKLAVIVASKDETILLLLLRRYGNRHKKNLLMNIR